MKKLVSLTRLPASLIIIVVTADISQSGDPVSQSADECVSDTKIGQQNYNSTIIIIDQLIQLVKSLDCSEQHSAIIQAEVHKLALHLFCSTH